MFVLTLTAQPNDHEEIDGTFSVTDGGVLTVHESGLVPRIYAPSAWVLIEDFAERQSPETPVIEDVRVR